MAHDRTCDARSDLRRLSRTGLTGSNCVDPLTKIRRTELGAGALFSWADDGATATRASEGTEQGKVGQIAPLILLVAGA